MIAAALELAFTLLILLGIVLLPIEKAVRCVREVLS